MKILEGNICRKASAAEPAAATEKALHTGHTIFEKRTAFSRKVRRNEGNALAPSPFRCERRAVA